MSNFSLMSTRFGLLKPNKACWGAYICTVVSWERCLQCNTVMAVGKRGVSIYFFEDCRSSPRIPFYGKN